VAREFPRAEAIVEGDLRMNFGEWWRRSGVAAAVLADVGVRAGDIVCLVLPSSAAFAVEYVAAMRLNAVVTSGGPVEPAAGDYGRRLTVAGRVDDAYIRGGYNVHPSEVENALLAHPAIHRVAVVGTPAPRIADYKAPDLPVWVDDLPVNATHKIDRTELRRRAARANAARS
jgi:acyl-CoA synthetase (AMP-forming)/AMP-acid ligase II